MKLGLWNVRSLVSEHNLRVMVDQAKLGKFHVIALTETKLTDFTVNVDGDHWLYNSGPGEGERKITGVGFLVNESITTVSSFNKVNDRIASMYIDSCNTKVGLIVCYAPTECSEDEKMKENFYEDLMRTVERVRRNCHSLVVLGVSTVESEVIRMSLSQKFVDTS